MSYAVAGILQEFCRTSKNPGVFTKCIYSIDRLFPREKFHIFQSHITHLRGTEIEPNRTNAYQHIQRDSAVYPITERRASDSTASTTTGAIHAP